MAVDPDLRDDLYYELVEDLRSIAFVGETAGEALAEVAETHADRRMAQALRIVASALKADDSYCGCYRFVEECADRIDPDHESTPA